MTAQVIYVDFRSRKRISERVGRQSGMSALAVTELVRTLTDVTPTPENPLAERTWVFGSQYEATRGVSVKDIAKVVRTYVRNTYSLMKLSVRSGSNFITVDVTKTGPVVAYGEDRRFTEAMKEIMTDIEGFAGQFQDDLQSRFYFTIYVW